jgi:hypothetical protein
MLTSVAGYRAKWFSPASYNLLASGGFALIPNILAPIKKADKALTHPKARHCGRSEAIQEQHPNPLRKNPSHAVGQK